MNYWLISDTHFNHTKLSEWGGRSGDWVEQMWKGIRDIPAGDILIHLGDVCIGNDLPINTFLTATMHSKGNGKRAKCILVRGNHDNNSLSWYEDAGWDFVCDGIELLYMGHYLHLTHRPARPQGNNTYNIHGHTHGNLHRSEEYVEYYDAEHYHIDISPELVGFTPIRLDTLIEKRKQLERNLAKKSAV